MTIFGGFDGNSQLDDAFCYNIDDGIWKKLQLQGDLPAPRSCPSFANVANHLYVFGGFDGINRLNDFYKINMNSGKVSRISQHGSIPCPRYVLIEYLIVLVPFFSGLQQQTNHLWRVQWPHSFE
jgi:hypothetical protein